MTTFSKTTILSLSSIEQDKQAYKSSSVRKWCMILSEFFARDWVMIQKYLTLCAAVMICYWFVTKARLLMCKKKSCNLCRNLSVVSSTLWLASWTEISIRFWLSWRENERVLSDRRHSVTVMYCRLRPSSGWIDVIKIGSTWWLELYHTLITKILININVKSKIRDATKKFVVIV
jgi:hypothetical protein